MKSKYQNELYIVCIVNEERSFEFKERVFQVSRSSFDLGILEKSTQIPDTMSGFFS